MEEYPSRVGVPAHVLAQSDSWPNSVKQLWATFVFAPLGIPLFIETHPIEGRGQLCFDDAAARMVAYHMHNRRMNPKRWRFVSWRVDMDGPLVGPRAKKEGLPPDDFSVEKYGPRSRGQS
jgi:hypothetical protein